MPASPQTDTTVLRWLVAAAFVVILNETITLTAIPRLMADFSNPRNAADYTYAAAAGAADENLSVFTSEVVAGTAEIGIKVSIEPVQWAQWLERVYRQRDYDMTIVAHVEPLDINIYARDGYYFGYASEAVKDAVARTKSAKTEAERFTAYRDAQRRITADFANVYLFMLPKITVSRAGLKGMWSNWPVPANPLGQLSWE